MNSNPCSVSYWGYEGGFMRYFIILPTVFFFLSTVQAQSFSKGNKYTATHLYGDITVSCEEPGRGRHIETFYCHEETLDPVEMDYFVSEEAIDADEVELTSMFNNKEVKQSKDFNSTEKKSKKVFNLWVYTLFQKPLLDYGKNTITYNYKKNGQSVKTGTFDVQVDKGPDRTCQHRFYFGTSSDCSGNGSFICSRYFDDENYCQ